MKKKILGNLMALGLLSVSLFASAKNISGENMYVAIKLRKAANAVEIDDAKTNEKRKLTEDEKKRLLQNQVYVQEFMNDRFLEEVALDGVFGKEDQTEDDIKNHKVAASLNSEQEQQLRENLNKFLQDDKGKKITKEEFEETKGELNELYGKILKDPKIAKDSENSVNLEKMKELKKEYENQFKEINSIEFEEVEKLNDISIKVIK